MGLRVHDLVFLCLVAAAEVPLVRGVQAVSVFYKIWEICPLYPTGLVQWNITRRLEVLQCPTPMSLQHLVHPYIHRDLNVPKITGQSTSSATVKGIYSSLNLQYTFPLPSNAIFSSRLSLLSTSPSLSNLNPIIQ